MGPGLKGLELKITPSTGSLLVRGSAPDLDGIFAQAEDKGFFCRAKHPEIATKARTAPLVPSVARQVVGKINAGLSALSASQMDIPSTAFVVLIAHAVREMAKGRLTTPSWFTALWFAASIYNGELSGLGNGKGFGRQSGEAGKGNSLDSSGNTVPHD